MKKDSDKGKNEITYTYNNKIETIPFSLDEKIVSSADKGDKEAVYKFAIEKIKERHFSDEIVPIETIRDLREKFGVTQIRVLISVSENQIYSFTFPPL